MRYRELVENIMEAVRIEQNVLVVVHPDSTCGSADFNLGVDAATKARKQLLAALRDWQGGVIILDGGLRHELDQPAYQPLQAALNTILIRAKAAKQIAWRRVAADPAQGAVIAKLVQRLDPAKMDLLLVCN